MKTFSATLSTRKAALSTASCFAVRIDTPTPLYLCNWDVDLTYDSKTFQGNWPIKQPSISNSGGTVEIGNVDGGFSTLFLGGDLNRKEIYVYEFWPPFADDSSAVEAELLFYGQVNGAEINNQWCRLPLGPLDSKAAVQSPRRRLIPGCRLGFKTAECGYSGATTSCPKTKAGCLSGSYGGFQFVPAPGTQFTWGKEVLKVK